MLMFRVFLLVVVCRRGVWRLHLMAVPAIRLIFWMAGRSGMMTR